MCGELKAQLLVQKREMKINTVPDMYAPSLSSPWSRNVVFVERSGKVPSRGRCRGSVRWRQHFGGSLSPLSIGVVLNILRSPILFHLATFFLCASMFEYAGK